MKKLKSMFMLSILSLSLCACAHKPATEDEVINFAKKNFGDCTLTNVEKISNDEMNYYFLDEEYKFDYSVNSKIVDVDIDGTKFGETESRFNTFTSKYYEYITDKIQTSLDECKNQYDVEIITSSEIMDYYSNSDGYTLATIRSDNISHETADSITKQIYNMYAAYDDREYFKDARIYVEDKDKNPIGVFYSKFNSYLTDEEDSVNYYCEIAHMKDPDAIYLRSESLLFKETGLDINNVAHVLGNPEVTEDSTVTRYYFESEGKTWFLIDVVMQIEDRTAFYNNYDEVMQ